MKFLILIGLVVTLSSVFCKEHQVHNRQNVPQRKYKDTKSKRGIGDYPLNLSFGAPSIGSFQPTGHVSSPFSTGLPNFSSYGGYGSGNLLSSHIGLQSSPSFSVIGSPSLSGLSYGGLSQPISFNQQTTEYAASAPTLNLASLLGGQANVQASYASPSIGLFSPEKTGPVTFTTQAAEQPRQQYTPVYATAHPVGSSRLATPFILGSGGFQLGTGLQRHSLSPTTLRSLGAISSLGSNGVSYAIPASLSSSPSSRDSSSHTVSGGYVIAGTNPLQSGSSPTYSFSGSTSNSSPSSSDYAISLSPTSSSSSSPSYQLSTSSSPSYQLSAASSPSYQLSAASSPSYQLSSASSPSYQSPAALSSSYQLPAASSPSSYQMSAAASTYSASPSNSFSTNYAKYNPSSSDTSTYSGPPLKLSSFSNYGSSSGPNSISGNYASAPSYSNSASTSFSAPSDSSGPIRHPITSYGTPASSYSIPSTSYGVPSSSQYVSNLNYNSQNSDPNSSGSYTSSSASSFSRPGSSYGSSSTSPSYDSIKNLDSNIKMSSASFSDPAVNYESSSSSTSSDSYSSYKNHPSSVSSNSVESYTPPSTASSSYESGPDSSSSYSNLSPRYLRYHGDRPTSSPYIENDESPGSSYDTISYSVPMGKY